MTTLSLKKKVASIYTQFFRWRLTQDQHDCLDKALNTDDIVEVQFSVTFKNGDQKVVPF